MITDWGNTGEYTYDIGYRLDGQMEGWIETEALDYAELACEDIQWKRGDDQEKTKSEPASGKQWFVFSTAATFVTTIVTQGDVRAGS